jgi:hypothetical protein
MIDRGAFRLSAALLFLGEVISLLVGALHPDRQQANNHPAAFAEYAASGHWTAIHLGQFLGMAVIVAGLLALSFALDVRTGLPHWANRFGAVSAIVALGLYGVLQAVDGVALKQAVDAWMSAPEAEKAARLASAEVVRWLEWGVRSYQSFMLGLSFLFFATVLVWTARTTRVIGYLMALSGIAYMMQGWVLGSEGFSAANTIPTLAGIATVLLWTMALLVIAWRMKEPLKTRARP